MTNDKRDLLDVLKAELEFLEKGGYLRPTRAAWRPQFIFQDSPSCPNSDPARPATPCSECVLLEAAPAGARERKFPCRHIPLNKRGDTLDSLYRSGTQEEIESALAEWLKAEVARLEQARAENATISENPENNEQAKFVPCDSAFRSKWS